VANLDQAGLKLLQRIVSKYYYQPKTIKKQSPPKIEKVKKVIKEKVPIQTVEVTEISESRSGMPVILFGTLLGISLLIFKAPLVVGLGIIIVSLVIGISLINMKVKKEEVVNSYEEVDKIIYEDKIIEGSYFEEVVPNKYSIKWISKGYIPFSTLTLADRTILIGPEELYEKSSIKFPTIKRYNQFYQVEKELKNKIKSVPFVIDGDIKEYEIKEESSYGNKVKLRGLEKDLMEGFIEISKIFNEIYSIDFNLHIADYNQLSDQLVELSNPYSADDDSMLSNYYNSEEGKKLEHSITQWQDEWKKIQNVLHFIRFESLRNQVGNLCYDLSNVLSYSAFNFYCPSCNEQNCKELLSRDYLVQTNTTNEAIYFSKNTRCYFDPDRELWKCKTCEKETEHPIPLHKNYDEILMPTYDKLIEENLTERLKAHNETLKNEIQYENEMESEIGKLNYENLSAIYALTDEMERLKAEITGENDAIKSLNEVSKEFEIKQNTTLNKINEYGDKVIADILQKTKEVIEKVDREKNDQMQLLEKELTALSKAKRKEDEIRDKIQRSILEANLEQIEVAKQGFSMMGQKLDTVSDRIQEGNEISHQGFNSLGQKMDENTRVTKDGLDSLGNKMDENTAVNKAGFNKLDKTFSKGTKDITQKISQGNAINSAIAKSQGINLHDEAFFRIDRKLSKAMIDVGGSLIGISTREKEEKKLNVK
jgi:hypothetical protein